VNKQVSSKVMQMYISITRKLQTDAALSLHSGGMCYVHID